MAENHIPNIPTVGGGVINRALERRSLLRSVAVLTGAAGVAAVGALNPETAEAADGDTVKVGRSYSGSSTTSLTVTPGDDPVLHLSNTDGPALRFNLLDEQWSGELDPGDLAATMTGPLAGIDYGNGPQTTFVATGVDLAATPVPVAVAPQRLLDTRRASSEEAILRSSPSARDARGRLTAGSWIDVAIGYAEGGVLLSAAFVNLTVVQPTTTGYLTVYAPGPRPAVSTTNVTPGATASNAAFVALGQVYQDEYVLRISSTTTSHVLLDLSGVVMALSPLGAEGGAASRRRSARQLNRAAALRRSLDRGHATS